MVFSSTTFLFIFLPIVLFLYYALDQRYRNFILLIASLLFYAWGEPKYVVLMIFSIMINWLIGIVMSKSWHRKMEFGILSFGVSLNLLILAYYKYSGFFMENLNTLLGSAGKSVNFEAPLLPIGISFMTFHSISYLVDIYRKQAEAVYNPLNMGVYISLFPQLVAGPIIRYHDVAEQIKKRSNSLSRFASGVERFVFGLGKKVLIANVLGQVADQVFMTTPENLSFSAAWLGIICYTFQIYFDFSGYSDMAIGLGRMFGFEFLENFNYPYISRSIREFWRRWHLSLSTWFRDYLYIPLGGNRVSPLRVNVNLFIVFLLCGLWHGSSWNFVLWGCLHGALLVIERGPFGRLIDRLPKFLASGYVMLLVMIGWVFFRAETLGYSLSYLSALAGFGQATDMPPEVLYYVNSHLIFTLIVAMCLSTPIFSFMARDWMDRQFPRHSNEPSPSLLGGMLQSQSSQFAVTSARPLVLLFVLVLCIASLASSTYNPFIYFRF